MVNNVLHLDPKKHALVSPRVYAYLISSALLDGMMIYTEKKYKEWEGYDLKLKESIIDHCERYRVPLIKLNCSIIIHLYEYCSILKINNSKKYIDEYWFPLLETCIFYAIRPVTPHKKVTWQGHAFSNVLDRTRELTEKKDWGKLEYLRDIRYLRYS